MHNPQQKVREFETAFARYLDVKYAVAVANGTAALHAALYAAGISHQDEVILSPLAHPEVAHAIRYLDGVPIYTDIDPQTGCLDPAAVKWRLSGKTKAVIATHYAGLPCPVAELQQLLRDRDIVLIEDASQGLGAVCGGRPVGTLSPLTVFDFSHPQSLYTELGGMVVTDSEEYYHWLTLFRDTGLMLAREGLVKEEGPWHFEAQEIGYNYRMTGLQASLGLQQLPRLAEQLQRRRAVAAAYYEALRQEAEWRLPPPQLVPQAAWYSLPLLLPDRVKPQRRRLVEQLLARGVQATVQYYPIYLHPIYLWQGHPDICTIEGPLCPRAEDFYSRVINLPVDPALTDEAVEKTVALTKKILQAG
ncbi:DegT/DnrJ/EryC1/StrS family aminotransferase [Desulforamulus hydrothermalis]|uniref:DegT/DnrJ/EryC1/StrS aminotransferase n=1 Tax=Desulforamulus hydrothermalis Lam5 = DSM 18033 TaxID=1121428 RepID=K8E0N5_9FIRM|nr:DegT/DnrJ/EryC1/StrS family aminotransferase [Desulforamulus hydrothermalis]CCO09157.1 DegT/DnrJ/EryC1/StrS aminotransferase [Desulforamulus hydrothermalis Lam5 = DSM 18033]SHH11524.1 dTDP-4-amino-4,6-dideoxygalactose transaminase [Desulforamulus hydrothermalis Lam5 = DSM 18033]